MRRITCVSGLPSGPWLRSSCHWRNRPAHGRPSRSLTGELRAREPPRLVPALSQHLRPSASAEHRGGDGGTRATRSRAAGPRGSYRSRVPRGASVIRLIRRADAPLPLARVASRRVRALPPRTLRVRARQARPGAIIVRPRLIRMLLADPALVAVAWHGSRSVVL